MSELTSQIYYLSCMKKLHAADATRRGYSHVMVRTVDTDAVVIAVAIFYPGFGLSLVLANS